MHRTHALPVRRAAVLGAGVMGAQIAAHFVNAGIEALLFELPAKEGDPNAPAAKAVGNLAKIDPAPLALSALASHISPANYEQHLPRLAECDLVIEAIAERMDWKLDLYQKIAPHLGADTVLASNTSGLSINRIADALPEALRGRFCGVHFFNPPRYMHLVELIPARGSEPAMLDALEAFLVTGLGKGVVRAKDTPNFIANRVGVFAMLAAVHHAERLKLGFEVVDAITGPLIGRPKSATFRTADVVGLDTFAHVVGTMRDTLADDPWHPLFKTPAWMDALIQKGALGAKTKAGVYRKEKGVIQVLDLAAGDYRPSEGKADDEVVAILKNRNAGERFAALRASKNPQAEFLWSVYRDTFHYCAVHLESIADNARDLDLALRWGFGWKLGPFETWQAAGWSQVAGWIAEDMAAGKTLATAGLPAWVHDGRQGVHQASGSWAPARAGLAPRSTLPVYRRQPYPDPVLGETQSYGSTVFETDAVRLWHGGDEVAVLSFKSKMHAIGPDVLEGTQRAIEEAEANFRALVIWQTEAPFSVGANLAKVDEGLKAKGPPTAMSSMIKKLKRGATSFALQAARRLGVADQLMAGKLAEIEQIVANFQETTRQLKFAQVPTVAAVDGLALGGGCEFVMHCTRTVSTLESYIGLVEVGVGLLPAGGGCKEFALRASREARGGDLFPPIRRAFENLAMGKVAKSAEEAREMGFITAADPLVMNRFELLHVARAQAVALAECGYRPPMPATFPVAGKPAIATLKAAMTNMLEGGYISEHDFAIGGRVAEILCGGEVEPGTLVDEEWMLQLERARFMELMATEKTQARIEHMLKTGKPLRN